MIRFFVASCREDSQERVLFALDRRNGKQLWQRVVFEAALERKHEPNSFASSTPETDVERDLYVIGKGSDDWCQTPPPKGGGFEVHRPEK